MAGLGPCFWGTVAAILAVIGLSLYPLIGQEAFYPALMFLDTNAIAQLLAVSVVSGTILLSIAGLWKKYEDEQARGNARSSEGFLTAKAKPTWTQIPPTHTSECQGIHVQYRETPALADSERASEESLITSHGATSVARGLQ